MKSNQALDSGVSKGADPPESEESASARGSRARERLIDEATRIFAEKGYAQAATREICQAAGVNVASIHYYFGDKAGLYRAVLARPLQVLGQDLSWLDDPALGLEQALRNVMATLLSPWGRDEQARSVMRLHLREMIEPTQDHQEVLAQHVLPLHLSLVRLLARHVGAAEPDDGLHQLAFALGAMAHDYSMSRDCMVVLAPSLLQGEDALDKVLDRLVGYAMALVTHERQARQARHEAGRIDEQTMEGTHQ